MNATDIQTRLDFHALTELAIDVAPLGIDDWRALNDTHVGPLERACGFALATSATHASTYVLLYCPELVAEFVDQDSEEITDDLLTLVEMVVDLYVSHSAIADVNVLRYQVETDIDKTNPELLRVYSMLQTAALDRWLEMTA